MGKFDNALNDDKEAVSLLEQVKKGHPDAPELGRLLFLAYRRRGELLNDLGRYREARADYDAALPHAEPGVRSLLLTFRIMTLAREGEHRQAVKDVANLEFWSNKDPVALYNLACARSEIAAAVARDQMIPLAVRTKEAEQHARRAIELLRKAQEGKFFENNAYRKLLDTYPPLSYIRGREDFLQLRRDIEDATKNNPEGIKKNENEAENPK